MEVQEPEIQKEQTQDLPEEAHQYKQIEKCPPSLPVSDLQLSKPMLQPQDIESSLDLFSLITISGTFQWKTGEALLDKLTLSLGGKFIHVRQITKLKCLSEETYDHKRKLKITQNESEEIIFGAETDELHMGYSIHYMWFSKLICNKLVDMGYNLDQHRVNDGEKQWVVPLENDTSYCRGVLYKKAQFLNKWETRYVIINEEGLFSYRNLNESFSFSINSGSCRYIWTRFDMWNESLVIKIKHNLEQTQFAIPISNYCRKNKNNWLHAFYTMIMPVNSSRVPN